MSRLEREDLRAKLPTFLAFAGGVVVVAVPLGIWKLAHAPAKRDEAATVLDAGADADVDASPSALPVAVVDAAAHGGNVVVGAMRVLECHDSGSTKTSPSDCDRPAAIEADLTAAITQASTCTHGELGTIGYEADVSFLRKHNPIELTVPRDERTLKSATTARDCAIDVKKAWISILEGDGGTAPAGLDAQPHAHGRYRIAITATYGPP